MNRTEKRRQDRLEAWFNSLTNDKKQIIHDFIDEKINSNNNMMTAISDICTVGALDDVLDVDLSTIRNVMSKTKSYLIEYGEYLEREKNGGIEMIENEEVRTNVKNKIKKYMSGKMDKAKGLKLLKHEFNLPTAELSDLWIECKSGSCSKEKDRVPVILNHDPSCDVVGHVVGSTIEPLIVNLDIDPKEIEAITKPEKKISLKVVRVTTEVEGEYGTYVKNVDGVKIGNRLYSDKDMVKKEKIMAASEYKVKMDNIKERMEALNKELRDVQDIGMKELERFTEIESVFDI